MLIIMQLIITLLSALPTPIYNMICLIFFIGVLIMLLKLIKLILDAIPFV